MSSTLKQVVDRVKVAKTDIADAIIAKGGTVGANDGLEEFAADIATIPSGGSSAGSKDVNFYDYDGTIVKSYTASEFAELSAMPDNPSHEGLTAQGWNWSLINAKAHVASYGKLEVGQMYTTSDGKTRIYIRLREGRLKPFLGLTGAEAGTTVSIDWGDESNTETVSLGTSTVYTPHTYATEGDYIISVNVDSGKITFSGSDGNRSNILRKSASPNVNNDRVYQNSIVKIEIGNSVTTIGTDAFSNCNALTSITIPNSVSGMGTYAFSSCNALTSITIPNSVTSIGNYAFYYCYILTSITIPNSVTSIGGNAFQNCNGLTSITIPNSVTTIGTNAFYGCYGLTSITIPNSVSGMGSYAFYYCSALTSITIPNSVTTIGTNTFSSCNALTSITIPNSVTSIGGNAFQNCFGLGFIKFTSATPPNVSDSSAFTNVPTDCIIYIPTGSLSAYTSAANYPSSSTYTYIEY